MLNSKVDVEQTHLIQSGIEKGINRDTYVEFIKH